MIDKVQKIREEVARIQLYTQSEVLKQVIDYIDKVQKEPVNEDLEEASKKYASNNTPWDDCVNEMQESFKAGAQWQKHRDNIHSKDLEELINKLSGQFPEVSFAKLSRIAVRAAKWQKEQFEKNRLAHCDAQTKEEAQIEQDFVTGIIDKEHRQPTFDDAIKYGMRLQRENMMKDATDAIVHIDSGGYPYIPQMELYDYDKDEPLAKKGDKYKVILIKED